MWLHMQLFEAIGIVDAYLFRPVMRVDRARSTRITQAVAP